MALLVGFLTLFLAASFWLINFFPERPKFSSWSWGDTIHLLLWLGATYSQMFLFKKFLKIMFDWCFGSPDLLAEWFLRLTSGDAAVHHLPRTRDTILYLRSFGDESNSLSPSEPGWAVLWWPAAMAERERSKPERMMCEALHRCGSFVALARPGKSFSPVGARRINVENAEWKETFSTLLDTSILVVLNATHLTPTLCWELRQAVERVDPARLLIFLPFSERWFRGSSDAARRDAYLTFRRKVEPILPCPLPPEMDNASLMGFQQDWTPIMFKGGFENALKKALSHVWVSTGVVPRIRPLPLPYRIAFTARGTAFVAVAVTFLACVVVTRGQLVKPCAEFRTDISNGLVEVLDVSRFTEVRRLCTAIGRASSRLDRDRRSATGARTRLQYVPASDRPQIGARPKATRESTYRTRTPVGPPTYLTPTPGRSTGEISRYFYRGYDSASLPRRSGRTHPEEHSTQRPSITTGAPLIPP